MAIIIIIIVIVIVIVIIIIIINIVVVVVDVDVVVSVCNFDIYSSHAMLLKSKLMNASLNKTFHSFLFSEYGHEILIQIYYVLKTIISVSI